MTAKGKYIKIKDNLCTYTFSIVYVLQGSLNVKRHSWHMYSVDQKRNFKESMCVFISQFM